MMKNLQKHIVTPISVYLIALGIGLLLMVINAIMSQAGKQMTWLSSIGTGVIASVVVAILIDIGNTKRQREMDERGFKRLLSDIMLDALSICGEACLLTNENNKNERRTFSEWVIILFSDKQKDQNRQNQKVFLDELFKIQMMIKSKHENACILYQNELITNNVVDNLLLLSLQYGRLRSTLSNRQIQEIASIVTMIGKIMDELDIKHVFSYPYSEEEFNTLSETIQATNNQ